MALELIAKRVSSYLLKMKIFDSQNEQEVFEYGLHRFLSLSASILPVILLSIVFRQFVETAAYLIFFLLLRSAAGGWHCSSSILCWATFQGAYLLMTVTGYALPSGWIPFVCFAFLLIAIGVIAKFAPLNHPNLDLSAAESKALHKKSLLILLGEGTLLGCAAFLGVQGTMLFYPSFGIFAVALFILLGKVVKQDLF